MNIYLSPSTQEHNVGKGNYGTEEKRMNQLADIVEPLLKANGFNVLRNKPTMTLTQVINDSRKRLGANGIHVALHTNAGGGVGTEAWYSQGSTKGKKLATCIYNEVAPITPNKDRGVKATTTLSEVRRTLAPACILEIIFHDNLEEANWKINNMDKTANAIVKGICAYAGKTFKPIQKPKPTPTGKAIYRVQIGAYGDINNANRTLEKAKKAGFTDAFIKKE